MATTWARGVKRVTIDFDIVTGDLISVGARYFDRAISDVPAVEVLQRKGFYVGPAEIPPAWVTTLESIHAAVLARINTDEPLP